MTPGERIRAIMEGAPPNAMVEGLTGVLFHKVLPSFALTQLRENRIKASPAFLKGAEAGRFSSKIYFLSTARSLTSKYLTPHEISCIYVLDGRKLSQTYRGKAVDYWGAEFRAISREYEQEDRIFLDEPYLENLSSYLLEVRLLLALQGYSKAFRHVDVDTARKIELAAKAKGISVKVFTDPKQYVLYSSRKFEASVDAAVEVWKAQGRGIEDPLPERPDIPMGSWRQEAASRVEKFLQVTKAYLANDLASVDTKDLQALIWSRHFSSEYGSMIVRDVGDMDDSYPELFQEVGRQVRKARESSLQKLAMRVYDAVEVYLRGL